MIGNVKNSIIGAYHAIDHKHLPRYLAEFCYRYNRRFDLHSLLPRFGYVAVRKPPMPMRLLTLDPRSRHKDSGKVSPARIENLYKNLSPRKVMH